MRPLYREGELSLDLVMRLEENELLSTSWGFKLKAFNTKLEWHSVGSLEHSLVVPEHVTELETSIMGLNSVDNPTG
jgi:hypothetical protein